MKLKPIKTEADYRAALKRLEDIFDAKLGTPESDELEILGLMVDDYENQHYPIDTPDPIEAIKIRMEEMHLKQVDLIPEIGGKSRVSEILSRKHRLTIDMIRKLATRLNLSSNVLIDDPGKCVLIKQDCCRDIPTDRRNKYQISFVNFT